MSWRGAIHFSGHTAMATGANRRCYNFSRIALHQKVNAMVHPTRVADLDELVLTVRDRTVRSYIFEAINAYRSGAYRAAIISTWIATTFDIISKLRELAGQGDANASQWARQLDAAIASNNIRRLQDIEDDLLRKAFEEFNFINSHEHEDLVRLKKDRNLCAHPAFISEDTLFQPSPDLVRAHIVHVITHLLSQMPVQGRSAIERIRQDMLQASFPVDQPSISVFLNEKYLNRARNSLIQSLVDVLTKTALRGDDPDFAGKERLLVDVLAAVTQRHPGVYEQRLSERLPNFSEALDDSRILYVFLLIRLDPRCWSWIGEPSRIRLRRILVSGDPKALPGIMSTFRIFDLLTVPELKPVLLSIFGEMDAVSQRNVISKYPRPEFAERAIELYAEVGSFRQAEALGQLVIEPMTKQFSADNIIQLLDRIKQNQQIYNAGGTKEVLLKLFDDSLVYFEQTKIAWKELAEHVLRYNEPNDYYAYPELQERLRSRGVEVVVPPENPYVRLAEEDAEEE